MADTAPLQPPVIDEAAVQAWFATRGWQIARFQREVWQAHAAGESGLIHAPTGSGKTLAAWLACLLDPQRDDQHLSVLWITPLRALAADTCAGLNQSAQALGLDWRIELRTGDTASGTRARQRKRMPNALVTTPESASLLLSYADVLPALRHLRTVVVDEWHELLGSKRGVQTELLLSRLRSLSPTLRTWGLSATLGNLDEAMQTLLGPHRGGHCVRGDARKSVQIQTLLPSAPERFPWSGHMGLDLATQVGEALRAARSSLVFTNTRAQAERWFEHLSALQPPLRLALHHGSLDASLRTAAEEGLKTGTLDAVVATSSLDLGVDFAPVDQVIQIGGPKGVARLLQRAGRSGHQPGQCSRILCVPTQALEIAEFSAARAAAEHGQIESRAPLRLCLDVLAQHLVTLALSAELREEEIRAQVQQTAAYTGITDAQWNWVMDFVCRGGAALAAYPQYRKVEHRDDGVLTVPDATVARRHRMSIGTITADQRMRVAFVRGGSLGTVEESFITRLKPGDSFLFAGRKLSLVRIKDMTAQVRAGGVGSVVPRWQGGRMPLSSELADSMLRLFSRSSSDSRPLTSLAGRGVGGEGESEQEHLALAPLLAIQSHWSALPSRTDLLVERSRSREGEHLFVFPFAGRRVHEGLSALLAYRLSRRRQTSFSFSVNDYGFELLARELPALEPDELRALITLDALETDLVASINASEMARRRFREIARIAGLVFEGYPGAAKTARQVQASSGLIFDSLSRFDPDNLLIQQALQEALEHQLDVRRLRETCARILTQTVALHHTERFTPLAFPLWAERISSSLSSEDWRTRIHNMLASLESAAGGSPAAGMRPVVLPEEPLTAAPSAAPRRGTRRTRRPRMSSFRSYSS